MDNVKYFIEMRYNLEDLKRVYERTLNQIDSIKEIKGISSQNYEIINDFKSISKNINYSEINKINLIMDKISNTLYDKCNHEWETDIIDINIERTMQIEYCKICESTKRFNSD